MRPARAPVASLTPAGVERRPLRRGDGAAGDDRAGPGRSTPASRTPIAAEDLLDGHGAEVADAEDLAGEPALAAGEDEARGA